MKYICDGFISTNIFSDIGDGWGAVVLDTLEEFRFVRTGVRSFMDTVPFWIGGSVNSEPDQFFSYSSDYIANYSGTKISVQVKHEKFDILQENHPLLESTSGS